MEATGQVLHVEPQSKSTLRPGQTVTKYARCCSMQTQNLPGQSGRDCVCNIRDQCDFPRSIGQRASSRNNTGVLVLRGPTWRSKSPTLMTEDRMYQVPRRALRDRQERLATRLGIGPGYSWQQKQVAKRTSSSSPPSVQMQIVQALPARQAFIHDFLGQYWHWSFPPCDYLPSTHASPTKT
jgi:hypothetical protein